jgi:hypothetical protein
MADFNVHSVTPSKNLLTYPKDEKIYLTMAWKSPPEHKQVVMISDSTPHTKVQTVYKQIDRWLRRAHNTGWTLDVSRPD